MLKTAKIFSLYAMRYDHKNKHFFLPDRRIKSFGDTAIVISDMDCFLRRILQQILNDHGELVQFLLDLVQYFDYQESMKLYPLFSKQQRYDYQNELRVAVCLLEPSKYSMDFSNSLIRSTEPLKLDIGDIRDIAFALSIDDFLELRFPSSISLRFPMSYSTKPSMFDIIVQDTRKILEHRVSPFVKPMVTIL